jgi:hypothetical protein
LPKKDGFLKHKLYNLKKEFVLKIVKLL